MSCFFTGITPLTPLTFLGFVLQCDVFSLPGVWHFCADLLANSGGENHDVIQSDLLQNFFIVYYFSVFRYY